MGKRKNRIASSNITQPPRRSAKNNFIDTIISIRSNRLMLLGIVLFIPTLILFWRVLQPANGFMIFGQDIHSWLFYIYTYIAKSLLQSHTIPYWNPFTMSGLPLLANPSGGSLFYPINILYIVLPLQIAFPIFFATHILLAGITMYWYMRRHVDFIASLGSAVLFAFSGNMISQIPQGHPETLVAMAYLPLIVGATELILDKQQYRHGFVLGLISLTLQILVGTHIMVFFTALFVLYFVFVRLVSVWLPQKLWGVASRAIACLSLTWILAVGISAVELVPFVEYIGESIRSGGLEYSIASSMSFKWNYLNFYVSNPIVKGKSLGYEFMVFIGWNVSIVLIFFTLFELFLFIKKKKLDIYWITIMVGVLLFFWLALGSNTFIYNAIYKFVPIYQLIRRPVRHLSLVSFLIPILFGLALAKIKWNWLKFILIIVVSVELIVYAKPHIGNYPLPTVRDDPNLIRNIFDKIGTGRVYVNAQVNKASQLVLYDNAGLYYGFPMINGYTPLSLDRYNTFTLLGLDDSDSQYDKSQITRIPSQLYGSQILNFLSTRIIIDPKPSTGQQPREIIPEYFNLIYENNYATVYENPHALSRFFLVDDIRIYNTEANLSHAIQNNEISLAFTAAVLRSDLAKAGYSEDDINLINCKMLDDIGSSKIRRYRQNDITISVNANCSSLLVTSEPYYPGWEASIDGKNVPILISNIAFRSVIIPKGQHTIGFTYNPNIYKIGFFISFISVMLSGFITYFVFNKTTIADNSKLAKGI